ncbi:FAD-linked sulfhydryl oxidase ALR [Culicoides brevitarsis]|uniref:FAD-linked sulfhydryl oxidase ALR n=1 Tax=Culicoides brevitarsis TaxID=469753 RepID=UPI00307BFFAB
MPEAGNVFQQANNKENQPCRTCTDFKTWAKERRNFSLNATDSKSQVTKTTTTTEKAAETPRRTDCPLDKDQLGAATWSFLHTMAAVYPEKPEKQQIEDTKNFFGLLGRLYPCEYCAKDLKEELKAEPPKLSSQHDFSQWLCRLHNKVNVKLGKPEFDCSKVNQRWRDGWLDGSCD